MLDILNEVNEKILGIKPELYEGKIEPNSKCSKPVKIWDIENGQASMDNNHH